jgi:hypothetical protein
VGADPREVTPTKGWLDTAAKLATLSPHPLEEEVMRAAIALAMVISAATATATPAAAQTAPSVSLASLLGAGYQIVHILDLTDEEQKAIWPNDAAAPFILVTLQKGSSLATCSFNTSDWVNLDAAAFSSNRCHQR